MSVHRVASTTAVALVALGCSCTNKPDDTAETGDSAVPSDPIVVTAVRGEGSDLVLTDRTLADGEIVQVDDGTGTWTTAETSGDEWVIPGNGAAYRVVAADEAVLTEAIPLQVGATAAASTLVLAPGTTVDLTLSFDDPGGLPDLDLALYIDDDATGQTLDPDCACWSKSAPWATYTEVEAEVALTAPAHRTSPGAIQLRGRLVSTAHDLAIAVAPIDIADTGHRLAWGDLHAHTGLSHDGCENTADIHCPSEGTRPGAEVFIRAASNGLDFVAVTDHAEWDVYRNTASGLTIDIWDEVQVLAAEAEGGEVVPLIGYEWTSHYEEKGQPGGVGGHRTVVLGDIEACRAWRVPAVPLFTRKPDTSDEQYLETSSPYKPFPADLEATLAAAGAAVDCESMRYVSYFHHPAYDPPEAIDWTSPHNSAVPNTVVEIYSEHGSSECHDLELEGCDWNVNTNDLMGSPFYRPEGSVQSALQLGFKVGFVGGTDNHMSDPGAGVVTGEVGYTATVMGPELAYAPGAVTGVLYPGDVLGRDEILDAIEVRRTVASSFLFDDVRIAALGADGGVYLPGDDVPASASPLRLLVGVGDVVDNVRVQLLDPEAFAWVDVEAAEVDSSFDLGPDDVRYVRLRLMMGDTEHRVFVSPFFGVEG